MVPWLITTPGWPGLLALAAGATARLVADPAIVTGATVGAGACAGAPLLRSRAAIRRRRVSSG